MSKRCLVCREQIVTNYKRQIYCEHCYRGRRPPGDCKTCGRRLPAEYHGGCRYCSEHCESYKAPAIYRFICPDGRSYVGSTPDHTKRLRYGFARNNRRLAIALERYPEEQWTFEILQLLPPACSTRKLRQAEQRHMERLHTLLPAHGFNVLTAFGKKPRNLTQTVTTTEVTDTAI